MRLSIPTERQRDALLALVRTFDRQTVADAVGRPVVSDSPLLTVDAKTWARCRAVAATHGTSPTEPPPAPVQAPEDNAQDPVAPMSKARWAAWRRIRTEWSRHEAGVCGAGCPLKGGR